MKNKKRIKKEQQRKKKRDKKMLARREAIREENRVQRLLEKIRYDTREKITPYRKDKE